MTPLGRALLSLTVTATPLLGQRAELELAEDPVVVPMSHATKHVTVEVEIGGRGPFLFQVDTYASIDACVDDDFAAEMGFEQTGTANNSDGRSEQQRDIVRIDDLRLGGAAFANMRALVDDYDWIERPDGRKVHGLLGFPAFRDVLLTFDYPGNRLVLRRGSLGPEATHTLPIDVTSGSPDIWVTLGDERLQFGIDTGSASSFSVHVDDAERLPMFSEPVKVGRARSAYTTFDIFKGALAEPVDLAGHRLDPVFVELSEGRQRRLLGYRVLRSFEVTFDQRERRVRFERAPSPEGVELSEEVLERWAGDYAGVGGQEVSIEREGDALFFRPEGWPRSSTVPLADDELLILHTPVRIRREARDGRVRLLVIEHPDRPPQGFRPIGG